MEFMALSNASCYGVYLMVGLLTSYMYGNRNLYMYVYMYTQTYTLYTMNSTVHGYAQ